LEVKSSLHPNRKHSLRFSTKEGPFFQPLRRWLRAETKNYSTGGNKKAKESSHFYSSVDVSSFIGPVPKVDQADDIKLVAGEIFASKQKTFSSFCYEGPFVQPLQRLLHAETKVPSAPVGTRRQKKIPSSIHLWMSYHSLDRDQKWIKLTTLNSLLVRLCCR